MPSYTKNRVKLREQIQFKDQKSVSTVAQNLNGLPLYFAQRSFTEMKCTFIKLQNEPLPKAISQELLITVFNVSHFLHRQESMTSNL